MNRELLTLHPPHTPKPCTPKQRYHENRTVNLEFATVHLKRSTLKPCTDTLNPETLYGYSQP